MLASFRSEIEEHASTFSRRLQYTTAAGNAVSDHERHLLYTCSTFGGDLGAVLMSTDGRLVGLHQERVNALRKRPDMKGVVSRIGEVDRSVGRILMGGLVQGCHVALLVHSFVEYEEKRKIDGVATWQDSSSFASNCMFQQLEVRQG